MRADGVGYLLALFVDLAGRPSSKLVPARAVARFQKEGVRFAGLSVGILGVDINDPDVVALPDPASYTPLPAIEPGLALVHCDPHVGGKPWPYAPRVILREAVRRAAGLGFDLLVGAEVEYYLLTRDAAGRLVPADAKDTAARPSYDPLATTRMYDFLTTVSGTMDQLGWGAYADEHEEGNGQYEQNFEHADPLTTADRVITLRYLLSTLADRAGMIATFMPKPFGARIGTGLHLHLSLWHERQPLFPDPADERGLGLSALAYSFIGGVIEHGQGLHAVAAPTINSYKRNNSLATVTPSHLVPRSATYGGNDRNHYVRVPEDGDRIEFRSADGCANPYLVTAAVLGAGLDGVARGADPGVPDLHNQAGQLVPNGENPVAKRAVLPPTLLHAVEAMVADPVVCGALDAAGAPVAKYFADMKRGEFFAWHSEVTPWEIERYLTGF